MPKVWIVADGSHWTVVEGDPGSSEFEAYQVDMNASLYRQVLAAEKKFHKFQNLLYKFYMEAAKHPDTVRRFR